MATLCLYAPGTHFENFVAGNSFSFVTTEESKNDKSFEKGNRNSGTGKFNKEPSTQKFADDSGKDAGGSGGGSFAENGLKAHNMFRKIHGAPEMKLDEKMSKEAEEYAKKLADMGTLQHADTDYGENLAMKCSSEKGEEMTAEEATKNWYEVRNGLYMTKRITFVKNYEEYIVFGECCLKSILLQGTPRFVNLDIVSVQRVVEELVILLKLFGKAAPFLELARQMLKRTECIARM